MNYRFVASDLMNLQREVNELGGFAGKEISAALVASGFDPDQVRAFVDSLAAPEALESAPREILLGLFLLNSLTCAALGEEEMAIITGTEWEAHLLTGRRLYFAYTRRGD